MKGFFKRKLIPNFTAEELDTAFISYSEGDKLFTFYLSDRGREILRDTAKKHGLDMSTFVRLTILEKLREIYDV